MRENIDSMKIALISRDYPPESAWNGIAVFYSMMANSLVKRGHEVHVICRAEKEPRDYRDDGVEIHRVSKKPRQYSVAGRASYMFHAWLKLRRLIERGNVEIVCVPYTDAEGFFCSLFERIPLVVTVHSASEKAIKTRSYSFETQHFFLRIMSFFEVFTIKRATRVIANSHATYRMVVEDIKIRPDRVDLVEHAIDTSEFRPAETNNTIREELGIANDAPLVLAVGRLESRKGTHILCECIPHVLKQKAKTKFVFLGGDTETAPDGGSFKRFLTNKAKLGNFTGNLMFIDSVSREKLIQFYQACDVLVSASLYESFGLTVIEAMACGKPVVATLTGIVPELESYGLKGFRGVPVGNSERLSDAILYFLSMPGKDVNALSIKNRELIEKEFSFASWIDKTIQVFEKAIQKKTS